MQYKNTKTGAIIDSPCIISGGDWVPFNSKFVKALEVEKKLTDEIPERPKVEEAEENLAEFDGITKAQIIQELDAFGIKYNPKAKKQELYDLMIAQGK